LKLLGWDYPIGEGLLQIIEKAAVHPITALTTLSGAQKRILIDKDIVLCKQALKIIKETGHLGIELSNMKEVKEELESLCK
jgi:hypothetical protein